MTRDELEFSISQYLDGTLPDEQRASLEARFVSDPEAKALLDQERSLTAALRSSTVPNVRWDQLAIQISGALDDQAEARMRKASWAIRFHPSAFIALAASVLLAMGIAIHVFMGTKTSPNPTHPAIAPATALLVQGPQEEKGPGPAVMDVAIGPGGTYAKAPSLAPYADEIDSRPAHVVIAASYSPEPAPSASGF